jgi:hypothetical protein
VRELGDQPALADAGIAGNDQQPRPPIYDVVPGLEDQIEFSIAPHQSSPLSMPRPSMLSAVRTWHVEAVRVEQSLRKRLCSRGRLDLQLVLQDFGALVVGADSSRSVACIRLQLHQRAVSKLLKGLQSHPDPAVSNGFLEVT